MGKFVARQAEPGQSFTTTGVDGGQVHVKANDQGVVQPTNEAEASLIESFDLPAAKADKKTEAGVSPAKED